MSINLNPIFDHEIDHESLWESLEPTSLWNEALTELQPLIQSQRRCGHCHMIGHTFAHCRAVQSDGFNFHLRILNVIQHHHSNNIYEITRMLLCRMTVPQLKMLMHAMQIEGPGCDFMHFLEEQNIIPRGTSQLRFKQDRITVMLWYYLNPHNNQTNNKLFILTKLVVDSSSFDCPICLNSHDAKEKITSNCNHSLCKPCLTEYFQHILLEDKLPFCSLCRTSITSITFTNSEYLTEVSNKFLL